MRKHWDRWGWVIPVVVFATVILRAALGRDAFCSANEHCFREWFSALGNWSAFAVAIPTLLYLSQQIKDANTHHQKSAALPLRRLRSLARNVHGSAKEASRVATVWMNAFYGTEGGKVPLFNKREILVKNLDEAVKLLRDKNFEAFEAEIYLPVDHAAFLCEQLEKIKSDVLGQPEWLDRNIASEIARRLHEAHALIKIYMDDVCFAAEQFLQDTSEYASLRG